MKLKKISSVLAGLAALAFVVWGCQKKSASTSSGSVLPLGYTLTINSFTGGSIAISSGTGSNTYNYSPDTGSAADPIVGFSTTTAATVTLTETANSGYTFAGWSGVSGCATATTCVVTMSANETVTANYTKIGVTNYNLTIAVSTEGTVTGTPSALGISVTGKTQTLPIPSATVVVLTAAANTGYTFSGWSGACTNTTGTCSVTMNAAESVTANFTTTTGSGVSYTLTVTGTTNGTVTSSTGNITENGSSVIAGFASGTQVTLTANPNNGYMLSSWSGGVCSGAATTCVVTMSANEVVTANFVASGQICANTSSGGYVTSTPAGISKNGNNCANFTPGTSVTLTETADSGYTFSGWSGVSGCTTGATCAVTAPSGGLTTNVSANFTTGGVTDYSLQVAWSLGGAVTSPGLTLTNNGSVNIASGTVVTLTANPSSGYVFSSWSNCPGSISNNTCTFTISSDQNASANFSSGGVVSYTLTADGSNGGTVTSSPSGINETGTTVSANFASGTSVTLTATAASGYTFAGWSSHCNNNANCSGTGTCTVTMNQDTTVCGPTFTANNTGSYSSYAGAWNFVLTGTGATGTCAGISPSNTNSFTVATNGQYSYPVADGTTNGAITTSGSFSDTGSSSLTSGQGGCSNTDTSVSYTSSGSCPAPTAGYGGPCSGTFTYTSNPSGGTITGTLDWNR